VTRACVIIPAFQAAETIGDVIDGLRAEVEVPIFVVDDGSSDATGQIARGRGALVLSHRGNQGKGAALKTGFCEAGRRRFDVAVTVDADGQHPGAAARAVLSGSTDVRALVLGVRDLHRDGAPASNRFGNAVANFFLSAFSGKPLSDTQCGLRRYPVAATLAINTRAAGYAFESEVILRAVAAGWPVVEVPIRVVYHGNARLRSHFRRYVDPTRIVANVAFTAIELRMRGGSVAGERRQPR